DVESTRDLRLGRGGIATREVVDDLPPRGAATALDLADELGEPLRVGGDLRAVRTTARGNDDEGHRYAFAARLLHGISRGDVGGAGGARRGLPQGVHRTHPHADRPFVEPVEYGEPIGRASW